MEKLMNYLSRENKFYNGVNDNAKIHSTYDNVDSIVSVNATIKLNSTKTAALELINDLCYSSYSNEVQKSKYVLSKSISMYEEQSNNIIQVSEGYVIEVDLEIEEYSVYDMFFKNIEGKQSFYQYCVNKKIEAMVEFELVYPLDIPSPKANLQFSVAKNGSWKLSGKIDLTPSNVFTEVLFMKKYFSDISKFSEQINEVFIVCD